MKNKCPCEGRSWRGNHSLQASWTHYSSTHRRNGSLGAGCRTSRPKDTPCTASQPTTPLPPSSTSLAFLPGGLEGQRGKAVQAPRVLCLSSFPHPLNVLWLKPMTSFPHLTIHLLYNKKDFPSGPGILVRETN